MLRLFNKQIIFFYPPVKEYHSYLLVYDRLKRTLVHDGYYVVDVHSNRPMRLLLILLQKIWKKTPCYFMTDIHSLVWLKASRIQNKICHFMIETDFLDKKSTKLINENAIALVVPTLQNKEFMIRNGIKVPVLVLQQGVDKREFPFKQTRNNFFTIGTYGDISPRKNIKLLCEVFSELTRVYPSMKLEILAHDTSYARYLRNEYQLIPNIKFSLEIISNRKLVDWLAKLDMTIFPSRGEGFGLGALESLSVGTPAAIVNWNGPTAYFNKNFFYELEYELIKRQDFYSNSVMYEGNFAEVKKASLLHAIEWGINNRQKLMKTGKKGSQWVQKELSWEKSKEQFLKMLADVQGV